MDLDGIKRSVNLIEYVAHHYGIECDFKGYAICPFHSNERNPSLQIKQHNGIWRCTDWHLGKGEDGFSGTIVDFVARMEKISEREAIKKLLKEFNSEKQVKKKIKGIKYYAYKNLEGKEAYRKVKQEYEDGSKNFWIELKDKNEWRKPRKNEQYEKFPYHVHRFKDFDKLIICEGEKDADTVNALNTTLLATSAPFGKSNWVDCLTIYFQGKQKILLYDIGSEEEAKKVAIKLKRAFPKDDIYIAKVPLKEREADITDYLNQFDDPFDYEPGTKKQKLLDILKNAEKFELFEELVINNDFLNLYVDSISRITDAPKIFILFSGIGLLSGILNKFYFRYPRKTHLNLYILLLAPSTFYRKTVCLDIANDYLIKVDEKLCLPESFTTEALFKILEKQNKGLINWRELNQVREFQMAAEYNKGLPAFLTDIYDFKEVWKRWTKGEGEIIIREPIISILAAGVTSWFTENLKKIDFEGGLWTRFLFIPGPEEERSYRLPGRFELNEGILDRLHKLNMLPPQEIDISKIESLIEEWGIKHHEQTQRLDSGILQAMFQRLEPMLLKLAAIFQLSHNQSTIIEPETFREAVKVIEYLKRKLIVFFDEEIHFSEFEKNKARVLKYLKKKKRILYIHLLRNIKMKARELRMILSQLKDEGQIKWQSCWVVYGGKD